MEIASPLISFPRRRVLKARAFKKGKKKISWTVPPPIDIVTSSAVRLFSQIELGVEEDLVQYALAFVAVVGDWQSEFSRQQVE